MHEKSFEALGLSPSTLAALAKKGFEEATPIQSLAIPRLLVPGPDLIARARTGTGKTAAFGLPLVDRLSTRGDKVRSLVLVPTRELALQVAGEIVSLRSGSFPRIAPVYGGASMGEQLRRLAAGTDIVVGTPGRVLDHIQRGTLDLSAVEYLVLDEADEMLDMGFIEDIETIMERCPKTRRSILFSATMPNGIISIARKHLLNFDVIEDASEAVTTELAEQVWLEVREGDRLEALCRVMDSEEEFYGIVFTATRVEAERLAGELDTRGYEAEALHGEITQDRRERVLGRFRDRKLRILVATDVAARGIDIERITHVVNWSLPHDPESYLHRVGRTGRAGNTGTAITFVTSDEYRKLFRFKRAAGPSFKKGSVPAVSDVLAAKRERIRGRVLASAELLSPTPHAHESAEEKPLELDQPSGEILSGESIAASSVPLAAHETISGTATDSDSSKTIAPKATTPKPRATKKKANGAKALPPESGEFWKGFADEILGRLDPREALAAALFEAFGSELDPARYREIEDGSVDAAATARLFIGSGKRDAATPRALASLVKRLSGLPDRLVGGIEIYENFSFVTVPFEAAEAVIAATRRQGGFPAVRYATPKGDSGKFSSGGYKPRYPTRQDNERGAPSREGYHGSAPHYGEGGETRGPKRPYVPKPRRDR